MTTLESITHNVYEDCGTQVERVQGDIDRDVYNYFWRHVIAFTHGSQQAIVNFMIQRLYEACREAGIQKVWDEDNNKKLVDILNRLNFNTTEVEQKPKPRKRNKVEA
jgi:hypothetical protein